ncbi:TPA: hypothetical protein ACH3X2_007539 [Trebouxia sp. C0005]
MSATATYIVRCWSYELQTIQPAVFQHPVQGNTVQHHLPSCLPPLSHEAFGPNAAVEYLCTNQEGAEGQLCVAQVQVFRGCTYSSGGFCSYHASSDDASDMGRLDIACSLHNHVNPPIKHMP